MAENGQTLNQLDGSDKQETHSKYHRFLQNNEVLTLHYLGQPYLVLSRQPLLSLKLPVSSYNYQDGGNCGMALQLILTCPAKYPLELPHYELIELRNVSNYLELYMRAEIAATLQRNLGLHMIVPVVTQLQMLLNNEVRRSLEQP